MSRYAVNLQEHTLLVSWDTGLGDVSGRVAGLPATVEESDALQLARTLTFLSAAAWRTYTHPEESAPDPIATDTTWAHDGGRDVFGNVIAALERPHLPHDGLIQQAFIVIEEAAHRVGRALHTIGDPTLRNEVAADVRAELAAVESAGLGELSGRARQAVTLSRADASPLQIAAADAVLRAEPLGSSALFTDVEPTAAAIAAAHWLHAAATVAARHADVAMVQVVAEADTIEPLPHRTPTIVLHQMEAGDSPREAVLDLIAHAMIVAEGRNPDLDEIVEWVAEISDDGTDDGDDGPVRMVPMLVESLTAELDDDDLDDDLDEDDLDDAIVMPDRLTPLDPRRPAVDLLEDLLAGIHGCWLVYREYAEPLELPGPLAAPDRAGPAGAPGAAATSPASAPSARPATGPTTGPAGDRPVSGVADARTGDASAEPARDGTATGPDGSGAEATDRDGLDAGRVAGDRIERNRTDRDAGGRGITDRRRRERLRRSFDDEVRSAAASLRDQLV